MSIIFDACCTVRPRCIQSNYFVEFFISFLWLYSCHLPVFHPQFLHSFAFMFHFCFVLFRCRNILQETKKGTILHRYRTMQYNQFPHSHFLFLHFKCKTFWSNSISIFFLLFFNQFLIDCDDWTQGLQFTLYRFGQMQWQYHWRNPCDRERKHTALHTGWAVN